jgi:hypothetical protein
LCLFGRSCAFSGVVRKAIERAFLACLARANFGILTGSAHLVAEIHRSHRNANDSPHFLLFFVRIAEKVLLEIALVVCRIGEVLQGKAQYEVVFAVMQYCRVGNSAYLTLLQQYCRVGKSAYRTLLHALQFRYQEVW